MYCSTIHSYWRNVSLFQFVFCPAVIYFFLEICAWHTSAFLLFHCISLMSLTDRHATCSNTSFYISVKNKAPYTIAFIVLLSWCLWHFSEYAFKSSCPINKVNYFPFLAGKMIFGKVCILHLQPVWMKEINHFF